MSRIAEKFRQLRRHKKKALIAFITGGDPGLGANGKLVDVFEKEGVDIVEIGVPFSDPLADGPVIQASSRRSLGRGTNLGRILGLVRRIRKHSQIPLVLMSYFNPVYSYGIERFARQAGAAGVDGLILPDVPLEEGGEIAKALRSQGIDLIYLLAPTSDAVRQKKICRASSGFVYFVSMTGVTGSKNAVLGAVEKKIRPLRSYTKLPVCVGFGISTPAQAGDFSRVSDGVIVGSAIVRALAEHPRMPAGKFGAKFIRPFVRAVKGCV